jgi:Transposase IS116/IS110/IS902 family
MPGSPLAETVAAIRAHHRARRFAMGIQQVLDRKLESYVRINETEWHVDDSEADRAKANAEALALIKTARKGEGNEELVRIVALTEHAREPADKERARHEKEMEKLAKQLPVAAWVESVPGLGMLGLATIIAETGDLSKYSNVAKVWKRLGYAPYNGKAGSTWKRTTWRGGDAALTSEEWIENPFSAKRYSLIYVISVWLKNAQWTGAAKTEDGVGKPKGHYGEVYAKRRAHTAETHPDWTKSHSHMDALRVMMKAVLKDLYLEWNKIGRQRQCETQTTIATASPASVGLKPSAPVPGSPS